jgi:hypothetical protein
VEPKHFLHQVCHKKKLKCLECCFKSRWPCFKLRWKKINLIIYVYMYTLDIYLIFCKKTGYSWEYPATKVDPPLTVRNQSPDKPILFRYLSFESLKCFSQCWINFFKMLDHFLAKMLITNYDDYSTIMKLLPTFQIISRLIFLPQVRPLVLFKKLWEISYFLLCFII